MTNWQVLINDNYFRLYNLDNGTIIQDHKRNVVVTEASNPTDNDRRYLINSKYIGNIDVLIGDITNLTTPEGIEFTAETWEAFYFENTGFNAASGGSEAFNEIVHFGQSTFEFDGVQTVFEIPHEFSDVPESFSLTFSDGANTDFIQSQRQIGAASILLTTSSPIPSGNITVYWQAFLTQTL